MPKINKNIYCIQRQTKLQSETNKRLKKKLENWRKWAKCWPVETETFSFCCKVREHGGGSWWGHLMLRLNVAFRRRNWHGLAQCPKTAFVECGNLKCDRFCINKQSAKLGRTKNFFIKLEHIRPRSEYLKSHKFE